jgi:hypothetical protein
MAYPQSMHQIPGSEAAHYTTPVAAVSGPAAASSRPGRAPQCRPNAVVQGDGSSGEHQLEKLEFALAVALTRGDQARSSELRRQIDALGGNHEEPGT